MLEVVSGARAVERCVRKEQEVQQKQGKRSSSSSRNCNFLKLRGLIFCSPLTYAAGFWQGVSFDTWFYEHCFWLTNPRARIRTRPNSPELARTQQNAVFEAPPLSKYNDL